MSDYAAWIGRNGTTKDIAAADRIAGLMALLDDPAPLPDALPPLSHWLLARPLVRQSDIDVDGHPKRGGDALLPPIALPRRMWAASEVKFVAPVPLGAPIEWQTTVCEITPKHGRSGKMVFVTLAHELRCNSAVAILERQHIVYREPAGSAVPLAEPAHASANHKADRIYTADPVALFRYSALTFNSHRIHYDRDYAALEGYPGLVVHGPFAATLLLDHARRQRPDAPVSRFSFRAKGPLFANQPFSLSFANEQLSITDVNGAIAMTAEVSWA